ncbi:MAG: TIR domain-containing protein [Terriglobia bacterium]
MPTSNYDVFISYRRQGGDAQALFIREKLLQKGVRVFLDVADLKKGYFDEALLTYIADAPSFIVILSPHSLDRCEDEDDWLRLEIAQAVKTNRNIIPVMMAGFAFPRELPPDIKPLPRHQGVEYSHSYFEAMIGKIVESIEAHRAEAERLERQKAERQRVARKMEAEGQRRRALAAEQEEYAKKQQQERETAERERRERETAEAAEEERRAQEKAEQDRLASARAPKKRPSEIEIQEARKRLLEAAKSNSMKFTVPAVCKGLADRGLEAPEIERIVNEAWRGSQRPKRVGALLLFGVMAAGGIWMFAATLGAKDTFGVWFGVFMICLSLFILYVTLRINSYYFDRSPLSTAFVGEPKGTAQLRLGDLYFWTGDFERAFEWYSKAAQKGNTEASYKVGLLYEEGKGVARSQNEARRWYEKAAKRGSAEAKRKLTGTGTTNKAL